MDLEGQNLDKEEVAGSERRMRGRIREQVW